MLWAMLRQRLSERTSLLVEAETKVHKGTIDQDWSERTSLLVEAETFMRNFLVYEKSERTSLLVEAVKISECRFKIEELKGWEKKRRFERTSLSVEAETKWFDLKRILI